MAFLMLLHEKMRLQRKQNKLTLKQLRNGNLLSRMEKKIQKREKYYSKLEKQLETQANAYKNAAKMQFSNMFGLGVNSINPNNLMGSSQAAMIVLQNMSMNPFTQKELADPDKKMALAIMSGAYQKEYKENKYTGQYVLNTNYAGATGLSPTLSEQEYSQYQQIVQAANSQVTQLSAQANNYQLQYENNISIWLQAQRDQLEAQQEWEMDLLAEEQADYEAEKVSIEAELELVKQRKEAVEQELGQSIKDAAPKFGLA